MGQLDISRIEPLDEDSGVVVNLTDLHGVPLDVTITVAGTYSRRFRDAQHRLATSEPVRPRSSLEQINATALALEAACIVAWDFVDGGAPLPITPDVWSQIAAQRPNWREQVQSAMVDHACHFDAARQRAKEEA